MIREKTTREKVVFLIEKLNEPVDDYSDGTITFLNKKFSFSGDVNKAKQFKTKKEALKVIEKFPTAEGFEKINLEVWSKREERIYI